MPALSPTMEEGKLAKWHVKVGDKVKSGDVIAEIETDKATMEVEAVDEGVLAKIVVPEGTTDVPVNQLIGLIAGEGEDAKAVGRGRSCGFTARRADLRREHGHAGTCQWAGEGGARFRLAARTARCQGRGHRPHFAHGLRPAWPDRRDGCQIRARGRHREAGSRPATASARRSPGDADGNVG